MTIESTVHSRILLLRAVNLGRTNKVPMKALTEAMTGRGLGEVSYLLQTGNLIVRGGDLHADELKRATEELIAEEFDVTTVAIARTPAELREILAVAPFEAPEGGSVHVACWDEAVEEERVSALAEERFANAQLHLGAREAYMRYEGGTQASKLSNQYLERRLQVRATTRNIRTLVRLNELVNADL